KPCTKFSIAFSVCRRKSGCCWRIIWHEKRKPSGSARQRKRADWPGRRALTKPPLTARSNTFAVAHEDFLRHQRVRRGSTFGRGRRRNARRHGKGFLADLRQHVCAG